MVYLVITKPIRIKGQIGSVLQITEGPITIKIADNYENEIVKISQMKIEFSVNWENSSSLLSSNESNKNANKLTFLFKLYPGSLVEVEDCDITCNNAFFPTSNNIRQDTNSTEQQQMIMPMAMPIIPPQSISKNKIICFQIMNCKSTKLNNIKTSNVSILTLISTTVSQFYQTIRAGENSIVNIEKCSINRNLSKPIAILNPLITKIVDTVFEMNFDNVLHVKFLKDDSLLTDNRKIYFEKNEIICNKGYGIYIDGVENFPIDLDIAITNNNFSRNKVDAIFIEDLIVNSLLINENKIESNKGNGVNLQKVYQKQSHNGNNVQFNTNTTFNSITCNTEVPTIVIKSNEITKNDGFGIGINDSRVHISQNSFYCNKSCGLILYSMLNNNDSANKNTQNSSTENSNNTANNTIGIKNLIYNILGTSYLNNNNFLKNGESGCKLWNYNHFTTIADSRFSENCEYGICVENEISTNQLLNHFNEKLKNFKNYDSNSKSIPKETTLYLQNSNINANMKSGMAVNGGFVFLDNSYVTDNLDYAIYTSKEEYRNCFRVCRPNNKNYINGNIGGPWGEVSYNTRTLCSGCTTTTKMKKIPQAISFQEAITTNTNVNNNTPVNKANSDTQNPNKCMIF